MKYPTGFDVYFMFSPDVDPHGQTLGKTRTDKSQVVNLYVNLLRVTTINSDISTLHNPGEHQ